MKYLLCFFVFVFLVAAIPYGCKHDNTHDTTLPAKRTVDYIAGTRIWHGIS